MTNVREGCNGETLSGGDGEAGASDRARPGDPSALRTTERGPSGERPPEGGDAEPTLIADRYRVLGRLGAGGYGVVYRAIDDRLEKAVAVKVLSRQAATSASAIQRFRNEALAAGRLAHPSIVAVSDFDTLPDGRPYLVMELVEGETLADRLRRLGRLPIPDGVRVARDICTALDRVHRLGIVHRDLTPSNIMLSSSDGGLGDGRTTVKVLDFGIAKLLERIGDETLTQNGQVVGTPAYMA